MFSQILKFVFILLTVFVFRFSYSYNTCSLEGDFVPWPWSDQHYSSVIDHEWIMMNTSGTPSSKIQLLRSKLLMGLSKQFLILKEQDMNGNVVSWGLAYLNQDRAEDGAVEFNIYQSGTEAKLLNYNVKIGYWKAPDAVLTEEEKMSKTEISPFRSSLGQSVPYPRTCETFSSTTDSVIGIIVEKLEKNVEDQLELRRYYGLTETPLRTELVR